MKGPESEYKQPYGAANSRTVNPHNLSSASNLVSNDFKIQCAYCEEPHYSASCDKVRAIKDCKDILLKAGKCFNCLKLNHKVKDCYSTRTCRLCHKRHHQSICSQHTGQAESSSEVKKDTATLNSNAVKSEKIILL